MSHQLTDLNALIDSFAHLYNYYRPRGALKGRILAEYLPTLSAEEIPLSHPP